MGKIAALLAIAAALAACGTADSGPGVGGRPGPEAAAPAATAEQLHGRWRLAEHRVNGGAAFLPGGEWWTADYFIELNPDGTFSELNFWTPGFGATGAWELRGGALALALDGEDRGWLPFAGERSVSVSPDGGTLTMAYGRAAPPYGEWSYTATFSRAPRLAGYGGGRAGPLVGAWELVDIVNVPLEYLVADGVEFLADGTGRWLSNPGHIPPGAAILFAELDAQSGLYAAPFAWSAEGGRATMEGMGRITTFEYEASGAILIFFYGGNAYSISVYGRAR